jgi:two-component system, sensor histidine kinase and response regulator
MDGLTLARAIKADPSVAATYLILLTSLGQRGQTPETIEAGIEACLAKPVRQSQLYDCLASVMTPDRESEDEDTLHEIVAPSARPSRQGPRLLVAEDNMVNQKVTVRMLEKLGYPADVVANGREALDALAQIPYPLVLMDCQMPELDGYEATTAIRAREGPNRHTPIIAMTAGAMAGDRERCLAAGMDDYISKPVRIEELTAVVTRWLARSEAALEAAAAVPDVADMNAGEADVDRNVLAQIGDPAQGGDPTFFGELVAIFMQETPSLLESLRVAAAQDDAMQLTQTAHTLKGSAGYFGATGVQVLCERLEAMARTSALEDAPAVVQQLDRELTAVYRLLEGERQRWLA